MSDKPKYTLRLDYNRENGSYDRTIIEISSGDIVNVVPTDRKMPSEFLLRGLEMLAFEMGGIRAETAF
ncbi:hypothetical protein HYT24_00050 [Candidatus Pacearchaeota archaeon]|nr:hypothetical protein [Candidatus Pacearchaeota archaeon]